MALRVNFKSVTTTPMLQCTIRGLRCPASQAYYRFTERSLSDLTGSYPIKRIMQGRRSTRDIALQFLVERALEKSDQKLLRLMTKRVGVGLRLQREKDVARCEQAPGQYMLWEIAR